MPPVSGTQTAMKMVLRPHTPLKQRKRPPVPRRARTRPEVCTATKIIRKLRLMEAVCTTDFRSGLNHSAGERFQYYTED